MRQGGREGGGSPGQGAADTQTVQVVHSCIPRQHCTALFHHRTALLCRAMHSGLSVQDSESLLRRCLPLEVHTRQWGARLESHPAKVLFYKPTSLDSTCSLCPQDCCKAFRATQQTLSSCRLLCTSCCCSSRINARVGETLDYGLEWQEPGLNKISHSLESVFGSMAELAAAWSGSRRPPVSCL